MNTVPQKTSLAPKVVTRWICQQAMVRMSIVVMTTTLCRKHFLFERARLLMLSFLMDTVHMIKKTNRY